MTTDQDNFLNNDEEENLRMENELLRLKFNAEFGGDSHSTGNLDPALENEFLKQMMAFEHSYANAKRVKLFDRLGQPDFKPADELSDEEIDLAFEEVTDLLGQSNIEVDFEGAYDNRTKYTFITDELFDHEVDDFGIPGMTTHFSYEEFHPNHKLDIENRANEFLSGWFEKDLDEKNWCFANEFILPDRRILSKNEVISKLKAIFDSYNAFTDYEYVIKDIGFELQERSGIGHAEGLVKYNAILENNEQISIKGPFKLYLSSDYGWWSIFHIVFPGFEY
jgi:hypothetical protein